MRRCPRCGHWHHDHFEVCATCWVDLGQMSFFQDEDDDEYQPPTDTVFDREEEARGYQ